MSLHSSFTQKLIRLNFYLFAYRMIQYSCRHIIRSKASLLSSAVIRPSRGSQLQLITESRLITASQPIWIFTENQYVSGVSVSQTQLCFISLHG